MNKKTFLNKLSEVCEWEYYSDVPKTPSRNKKLIKIKKFKNITYQCNNCCANLDEVPTVWHIKTKGGHWVERCAHCKKYKDNEGNFSIVSRTDAY
jgi:hypothetical protein